MTVGLVGKALLGIVQLGAGEGTSVASFALSPSVSHTVGGIAVTATFINATSSVTNTFSIFSGPAANITKYFQIDSVTATFSFDVTTVSTTPIVFFESQTGTYFVFSNAAVVPDAPTGLVGATGNQRITFSFVPPVDNGGTSITNYIVVASNGATGSGSSSPVIVAGLVNGTSYTATVTAVNSVGTSVASSSSSGVTPNGFVGSNVIQQIAPFLSTDTLVTPGYRVFSGSGVLKASLVTSGIATITGVSNGRIGAISVATDTYGGSTGYALWETGQTTNVYAPRELFLPPLFPPGTTGTITKVTVFPYGTTMTSPGYQLYQDVAGVFTAIGSRVTAGVTAISGVTTGVSADVSVTLNSDKSWRGMILWDNGAGIYSQPDEVFIPPFSTGMSMAIGTAVIDFSGGTSDTSLTLTGQANILSTSQVDSWLIAKASSNNGVDEHWAEDLEVVAGNIVPGTGFTIYLKCRTGRAYGQYNVQWAWV